jgi:hypothetical protein
MAEQFQVFTLQNEEIKMKKTIALTFLCIFAIGMGYQSAIADNHAAIEPEPIEFLYSDDDKDGQLDIEEAILFVDSDDDNYLDEDEPMLVMKADDYCKIFVCSAQHPAPLERMVRAQIGGTEYIVLNHNDLEKLDSNQDGIISAADENMQYKVYFVDVDGTVYDSFITTKADLVELGQLKAIVLHSNEESERSKRIEHEAHFKDGDEAYIKSSKKLMPHVGL